MKSSYSRIFTVLSPKRLSIFPKEKKAIWKRVESYFTLYMLFLFVCLLVLAIYLYKALSDVKTARLQEEKTLSYWQEVIAKHSRYPDAYYKAAVSSYRLKKTAQAQEYLEKALELDPMFKQAMELRERIDK